VGLILAACVIVGSLTAVGTLILLVQFVGGRTVNLFEAATPPVLTVVSAWVVRHYLFVVAWLRRGEEVIRVEGGMLHRHYAHRPDPDPVPVNRISAWGTDATRTADKSYVAFAGDPLQGPPEVGYGGSVRFSYKGDWYHIGPQLTEAEAERVLEALSQHTSLRVIRSD
jgi:hypothetical protein